MVQVELNKKQIYYWSSIFIMSIVFLLGIIYSRSQSKTIDLLNIDVSILEVESSLHEFKHQYVINQEKLTAQVVNKFSGQIESVLNETTIDSTEALKIISLIDSFKVDHYINKCIEDGEIMTIIFKTSSITVRTITFHNKYNVHLEQIIRFINTHLKNVKPIFYNKTNLSFLDQTCYKN